MERRLAAILAADVVGYSRLVRADEEGTLKALRTIRDDLIDPKIAEHKGRIVRLMGDGMLVEFSSVVDAVRAAVEIQRAIADRNVGVPEETRIEVRVGINLGDVVIDEDDIQGDGVNVAARLESLAEPGGIYISGSVYEQVRDRLALPFEDLGERTVKNIDRPVRVYRALLASGARDVAMAKTARPRAPWKRAALALPVVIIVGGTGIWAWLNPWIIGLAPPSEEATPMALPDKPSIAVLPFANISADPEQEYFADGITDDLITDLSKVSGLFVIARNSVFTYKGKAVKVQDVARELGVRYVLEGSVRQAGDRVRVNAQLIDAINGHHLWAERYDRAYTDVFAVQDEVIGRIVSALSIQLTQQEQTQLARLPTENLEAYDNYLRAERYYHSGDESGLRNSLQALEAAIALDPAFAQAYGRYARAAVDVWRLDYISVMPGPLARRKASDAASKAIELDPSLADARQVAALLKMVDGAHTEAVEEARQAIYLDPNNAEAYLTLAIVLGYAGRHAEALDAIKTALRLNPKPPLNLLRYYGWVLVMNGEYARAIEVLEPIPETTAGVLSVGDSPGEILAMAYLLSGRESEARERVARLLQRNPFLNLAYYEVLYRHHKREKDLKFRLDALRRAGLPEWPFAYHGRPENRLGASEIMVLATQGAWTGWDMSRGLSFVREASNDGSVVYANAETLMTGAAYMRDDMLCERYEIYLVGREQCGYVYRNPEGTPEEGNEYTYVNPVTILRFSISN